MNNDFIDYLNVKPSGLCAYTLFEGRKKSKSSLQTHLSNFQKVNTTGDLSAKSRKKLKLAIDWLVFLSPVKRFYCQYRQKHITFKINFITLTLSAEQFHTDNWIKSHMLNQFFTEMRQRFEMKFYLWRAEPQKNGNIHFHITTNVYIPHFVIRTTWNRIQRKCGYIAYYRANNIEFHRSGFKLSENKYDNRSYYHQYKSYVWNVLTNWDNPNSTDVHSVRSIRNISAYLTKYLLKNSEVRKIEGNSYGVSDHLKKFQAAVSVIDQTLSAELNFLVRKFYPKIHFSDHSTPFNIPCEIFQNEPVPEIIKLFNDYFAQVKFDVDFKG